jgi:hypothetical protein
MFFCFAEVSDGFFFPKKRFAVCLVGWRQKALLLPLLDKRD